MSSAVVFLGSIALFYFLVMIPVQYSYISGMKDKLKRTNLSQEQLFEKMSFEEEQLHFSIQGNPFNIPSTIVANLIYKLRHGNN